MGTTIAIVVFVIVIGAAVASFVDKQKRKRLMAKYGDPQVVGLIMKKRIWESMSEEQLIDSLGRPIDKDQKVYKTKVVETFKYNQTGKNRFRTRVRVENGVVVGWEQK